MLMHALMVLSKCSPYSHLPLGLNAQYCRVLPAIGLQYGWRSFAWIATIPPFAIVLLFKIYIDRVFVKRFRYYVPTEQELLEAKVHSARADSKGNRLEKRFGHPALHADLFTPMLHAKLMPLLAEVYKGRLNNKTTKLDEYGGQAMDAQVLPGGLTIAAINQVRSLSTLVPLHLHGSEEINVLADYSTTWSTIPLNTNATVENWIGTLVQVSPRSRMGPPSTLRNQSTASTPTNARPHPLLPFLVYQDTISTCNMGRWGLRRRSSSRDLTINSLSYRELLGWVILRTVLRVSPRISTSHNNSTRHNSICHSSSNNLRSDICHRHRRWDIHRRPHRCMGIGRHRHIDLIRRDRERFRR